MRIHVERAKCFRIDVASDLQPITNLVTPNRGSGLGTLVARNITVVKTLVFQSLLDRLDCLTGVDQAHEQESDYRIQYGSFHGRDLRSIPYLGFACGCASACVACRMRQPRALACAT